jgi:hypothetical protein
MKFIFPILFILISIVVFIFGVNGFYKEVSIIKEDINVYNLALDNSTDLLKKEDSLIKSYNQITDIDKERLNSFLPSSVNNIQFILEVERIANIYNMPIKDIKFEAVRKDKEIDPNVITVEDPIANLPYGIFPIEFKTEGRYNDFLLFLKGLEYNLRLADIKSISFSIPDSADKNPEKGDPNVYVYSLKVETYWLK